MIISISSTCGLGSGFNFETHYDGTILSGQIPALVLQPLVENAIVHGLGACMEDGQIYIGLSKVEYGERESGLCRITCRANLGQEEERDRMSKVRKGRVKKGKVRKRRDRKNKNQKVNIRKTNTM